MCIIGGLGSVLGSIFGAVFITLMPIVLRIFMETVGVFFIDGNYIAQVIAQMRLILFGGLIIFFLVVEPDGLNKLWQNIRNYFRVWPFSY
jgi:branched-chain amino acid transport system permease protein